MTLQLTRFAVYGLHGKFDVDIPIHDNRLILVGVNGLGKTTVVNLLYFLLTTQWWRLLETEFLSIEICMNGMTLNVPRKDIQDKSNRSADMDKIISRLAERLPIQRRIIENVLYHPSYRSILNLPSPERAKAVYEFSRELDIPASYIVRMLDRMPAYMSGNLFESKKDTAEISALLSTIKNAGNQQVIYLPTFRRIEQDLKSIFPNLDDEELRKLTTRGPSALNARNLGHVELVQFGMHDVEKKIADELGEIREQTRSQLTNLTASYLKDIISNRADTIKTDLLHQMNDALVTRVLNRVEENTLSQNDKEEVRLAIGRIRDDGSASGDRDKYLAYFFSRVLEIYVSLAEREENIKRLEDTCNRYLEKKSLRYNEAAFTVEIVDADNSVLSWKVLSSGEKQVVSLFTHLYLSRDAEQIVIIDEPELSLSVEWQKSLLPDISDSAACKFLVAVTHSPFIYANKLDRYAVDLSKFITFNPRAV